MKVVLQNLTKVFPSRDKKAGKEVVAVNDFTFEIPDGEHMYDFVYQIADDPDGMHEQAEKKMKWAMERNKRLFDAGIESFIL